MSCRLHRTRRPRSLGTAWQAGRRRGRNSRRDNHAPRTSVCVSSLRPCRRGWRHTGQAWSSQISEGCVCDLPGSLRGGMGSGTRTLGRQRTGSPTHWAAPLGTHCSGGVGSRLPICAGGSRHDPRGRPGRQTDRTLGPLHSCWVRRGRPKCPLRGGHCPEILPLPGLAIRKPDLSSHRSRQVPAPALQEAWPVGAGVRSLQRACPFLWGPPGSGRSGC